MMNDNPKYSAKDLHRYHTGLMTAMEMHALEKAALEDPFLADALEGYEFTQTPAEDIDELKSKLFSEKKKTHVVWIPGLLRAAAVLILAAGFSWIIFKKGPERQNPALATKDNSALTNEKATSLARNETFRAPDTISEISTPRKNRYAGIDSTELAVNTPPALSIPQVSSETGLIASDISQGVSEPQTIQEVISVPPVAKEEAANTDDQKTFAETDYYAGKARTAELSKKDKSNAKTLSATAPAQSRSKFMKPSLSQSQNQSAQPDLSRIILKNVTNAASTDSYNAKGSDSVKTSIQLDAGLHGEVIVTFNVTGEGTPTDIKVIKNLCMSCDAESVRFISSQKWKLTDPARLAEVTIRF